MLAALARLFSGCRLKRWWTQKYISPVVYFPLPVCVSCSCNYPFLPLMCLTRVWLSPPFLCVYSVSLLPLGLVCLRFFGQAFQRLSLCCSCSLQLYFCSSFSLFDFFFCVLPLYISDLIVLVSFSFDDLCYSSSCWTITLLGQWLTCVYEKKKKKNPAYGFSFLWPAAVALFIKGQGR